MPGQRNTAKERPRNTAKKHGGNQMISFRLRILGQTLPFLLIAPLALAQTPASKAPSRAQATAALNQPANPGAAHYTRQQIDQLVAPIALYPDQLLSQVLMAATYPQQIAEAAQWLEQDRVYVPVYNPTVVYGQWQDREFPPVYLPPPREFVAETIEPGFEVSRGFAVVAPLWGWSRPDWRANRITVNRTEYTRITRNV